MKKMIQFGVVLLLSIGIVGCDITEDEETQVKQDLPRTVEMISRLKVSNSEYATFKSVINREDGISDLWITFNDSTHYFGKYTFDKRPSKDRLEITNIYFEPSSSAMYLQGRLESPKELDLTKRTSEKFWKIDKEGCAEVSGVTVEKVTANGKNQSVKFQDLECVQRPDTALLFSTGVSPRKIKDGNKKIISGVKNKFYSYSFREGHITTLRVRGVTDAEAVDLFHYVKTMTPEESGLDEGDIQRIKYQICIEVLFGHRAIEGDVFDYLIQ